MKVLFYAAATANMVASLAAVQGYATFESPASRYGHYEPDLQQIQSDPFLTSRCATRAQSLFPAAATVWAAKSSPCITLKEVGPFVEGTYKVSLLDSSGAAVYEEVFAATPLGNDLVTLHQAIDANTGLFVYEWCAENDDDDDDDDKKGNHHRHSHHHHRHDRECVPRNDLVVTRRRLTLTLPKDLVECTDCTLQLATKVDGGGEHFACANIDVSEELELPQPSTGTGDDVCVSENAELTRYAAAAASVWAVAWFWGLWKWTLVTYAVAYVVVLIVAFFLGRKEKSRLALTGLPVYSVSEQPSKREEAAGVTDHEAPEANLIINTDASSKNRISVLGMRGSGSHKCCASQCEPSALRVGLGLTGPRRARHCMRGVCAFLSFAYIITGIVAALLILHYQA